MSNTTTTEWIEKAKKLAGEYAHCYAFVGDDTMPIKHRELMAHLESVSHIIEDIESLISKAKAFDSFVSLQSGSVELMCEKAMLYDNFKSRIDNGVRMNAKNYAGVEAVQVFEYSNYESNSTLILDDGVEL